MAEAVSWTCEDPDCGFPVVDPNIYRCPKCDKVKPYLSTPSSPSSSLPVSEQSPESVRFPSQNERDSAVRTFDVHTNYASCSRNPTQFHTSGLEHETDNTEDDIQFPDKECRLVLLGKTGNGKSATGNSILGREAFDVSGGMTSVTRYCELQRERRFGIKVQVVDTCGLFDTHKDKEKIIEEIGKCLSISSPGPHALISVLKYSQRFTQEEVDALRELRKIFGESALKKSVVVFTHTEELWRDTTDDKEARNKFRKALEASPDNLKRFIKKIDNRYLLINNNGTKGHRDRQVRQLLEIIAGMTKGAEGQHCSSDMLQEIEGIVQSEEDECLQETGFRPTEGNRERIRNELRDDIEKGKRPSLLRRIIEAIRRFFSRWNNNSND